MMPVVRESTTAVIVRGERLENGFASEPYEAGWASEAVVFLAGMDAGEGGTVSVQISPDGILWTDEGTTIAVPGNQKVAFGRVKHFGNWIRIKAETPPGVARRVMATIHFKG